MVSTYELDPITAEMATRQGERRGLSMSEQISRWLVIGRAIEDSNEFDYQNVDEALNGKRSPDNLTGVEQEVWSAELVEAVATPTPEEAAYFEACRREDQNVGRYEYGNQDRQSPGSAKGSAIPMDSGQDSFDQNSYRA